MIQIFQIVSLFFVTQIPDGEVDSLPINFFLNNLLSVVSFHGDSGSSKLECDNCESGDPPVNRCNTCCHFLCEFCTQAHRRGRGTSSHGVVSIEEAKKMGSVAVTKPSLCNEHDGELLKLFCETCDEAICRDCTIVKHREHHYTFVKDAFAKNKKSVVEILSKTKGQAGSLKKAIDGVSEMRRSVDLNADQTVQEVLNCFQKLSACLNARCEELIHDVEEIKKVKQKSLEIQQEELEAALGSVQSSVEFTEKALENGNEVEILNMRKQISSRLEKLNSSKWQLEPCVHDTFTFLTEDQFLQRITNFGHVASHIRAYASMSTVTLGHGIEGLMYNTISGQPVEFIVTAKEWDGRKLEEGTDACEVEIRTQSGETAFSDYAKDIGYGTYSFCFTPNKLQPYEYQMSVKLNTFHVKDSPCTWITENWKLCTANSNYLNPNNYSITLDRASLRATYRTNNPLNTAGYTSRLYHQVVGPPCGFGTTPVPLTVFGTSQFQFGRHSWKVQIRGDNFENFCFGVGVSPAAQQPCQNKWTWTSGNKWEPLNQLQKSTMTACSSGNIIEFYLDCDNGTLKMYNQGTKEFDTWYGVNGIVRPMFQMGGYNQQVSLVF